MIRLVRRLLADTAYVLVAFPVTLVAFVVCFTLFCVGGGLAILWIGLPIMAVALRLARWFADVERARLGWVFDGLRPIGPRHPEPGGLLRPLSIGRYWAELAFSIVAWITATIGFTVVVSWWATALGGLTYPAWQWALPDGDDDETLPELIGLGHSTAVEIVAYLVMGIVALALLPLVVRAMALMQAGLTRAVLGPPHVTGAPLPPPPPPNSATVSTTSPAGPTPPSAPSPPPTGPFTGPG